MKKRSIVIVLAVALLLVLAVAGTASAYTRGAPVLTDPAHFHPAATSGSYNVHITWDTSAGKPVYWTLYAQMKAYNGVEAYLTWFGPYKFTSAQLRVGEAIVGPGGMPFYFNAGITDYYYVEISDRKGNYDESGHILPLP